MWHPEWMFNWIKAVCIPLQKERQKSSPMMGMLLDDLYVTNIILYFHVDSRTKKIILYIKSINFVSILISFSFYMRSQLSWQLHIGSEKNEQSIKCLVIAQSKQTPTHKAQCPQSFKVIQTSRKNRVNHNIQTNMNPVLYVKCVSSVWIPLLKFKWL